MAPVCSWGATRGPAPTPCAWLSTPLAAAVCVRVPCLCPCPLPLTVTAVALGESPVFTHYDNAAPTTARLAPGEHVRAPTGRDAGTTGSHAARAALADTARRWGAARCGLRGVAQGSRIPERDAVWTVTEALVERPGPGLCAVPQEIPEILHVTTQPPPLTLATHTTATTAKRHLLAGRCHVSPAAASPRSRTATRPPRVAPAPSRGLLARPRRIMSSHVQRAPQPAVHSRSAPSGFVRGPVGPHAGPGGTGVSASCPRRARTRERRSGHRPFENSIRSVLCPWLSNQTACRGRPVTWGPAPGAADAARGHEEEGRVLP